MEDKKRGRPTFGTKKKRQIGISIDDYSRELAFFVSEQTKTPISVLFEKLILKEAKRISKQKGIPLPENTEE